MWRSSTSAGGRARGRTNGAGVAQVARLPGRAKGEEQRAKGGSRPAVKGKGIRRRLLSARRKPTRTQRIENQGNGVP